MRRRIGRVLVGGLAVAAATPAWAGSTELVSVSSTGERAYGASEAPTISADGRYIAFVSDATNLVPGDTNDRLDVFVRDRQTRTTERVSIATDGTQANGNNSYDAPAMSATGRYVAFVSSATNLVPGATKGGVFVRDRQAGTTTLASISSTGEPAIGDSPAISADGRFVAFGSRDVCSLTTPMTRTTYSSVTCRPGRRAGECVLAWCPDQRRQRQLVDLV